MTQLATKHLKLTTWGAEFMSVDAFEMMMADKTIDRFVYSTGNLAFGACKDRDLYDLRKRTMSAYEQRRGQLTQKKCALASGEILFFYIFTKRKFLEEET